MHLTASAPTMMNAPLAFALLINVLYNAHKLLLLHSLLDVNASCPLIVAQTPVISYYPHLLELVNLNAMLQVLILAHMLLGVPALLMLIV